MKVTCWLCGERLDSDNRRTTTLQRFKGTPYAPDWRCNTALCLDRFNARGRVVHRGHRIAGALPVEEADAAGVEAADAVGGDGRRRRRNMEAPLAPLSQEEFNRRWRDAIQ